MNTREINSSSWPMKYYFIAALPLAVITVIMPLYVIKVVALLTRMNLAQSKVNRVFLESIILVSFLLNLCADILSELDSGNAFILTIVLSVLFFILLPILWLPLWSQIRTYRTKDQDFVTFRRFLWEQRSSILRVCNCTFTIISCTSVPWFELPFFCIYYVDIYFTRRRKHKSMKII